MRINTLIIQYRPAQYPFDFSATVMYNHERCDRAENARQERIDIGYEQKNSNKDNRGSSRLPPDCRNCDCGLGIKKC